MCPLEMLRLCYETEVSIFDTVGISLVFRTRNHALAHPVAGAEDGESSWTRVVAYWLPQFAESELAYAEQNEQQSGAAHA